MLLLPIIIPFFGGLALLFLKPQRLKEHCQGLMVLTGALVLALPFAQLPSMSFGQFPFDVVFLLQIDGVALFFSWIFVLIWWLVLQYAYDYFAHDEEKNRFFSFYLAALGCMIGVAYAGNLVTLYLFFEFLGLVCVPLIAHDRSEEAMRASRKYLYYSVAGAFMGLTSIFYFFSLELPQTFQAGGIPELASQGDLSFVLPFTLLAVVGFGCKAGLFPLHGWLKVAHPIAPAPASAVLSGITTKAGVIAILRLLYFVVGVDVLRGTFVQTWGLSLSMLTILMGSMLAYREKVLKTRLAYSTVSNVSYVIFSLFLFNVSGFVGAMLQVLFHAMAKTMLFLFAGNIIHETGRHDVEELSGLGRSMPTTFALFTVASLSLVGLPLTGGFISKWYIAVGGVAMGLQGFAGVGMIMLSALLTAGYLLPIATAGYLGELDGTVPNAKPSKAMTSPLLAVLVVALGIYPTPIVEFLMELANLLVLGGNV